MSETDVVTIGTALPRIRSVTAQDGYEVAVTWNDDSRAVVDLAPLILSMKFYGPLRDDPELFRSVHVAEHGTAIRWGSADEIDMPATSIQRLSAEMMMPQDFKAFMQRHSYSLDSVAAELGISRRLAAYYAKERDVPRYIALACRYLDAKAQSDQQSSIAPPRDHAATSVGQQVVSD